MRREQLAVLGPTGWVRGVRHEQYHRVFGRSAQYKEVYSRTKGWFDWHINGHHLYGEGWRCE